MTELHGLQSRLDEFRAAGAQIIAISPDSVEKNVGVVEKLDLGFRVLSDESLEAIQAFGLLHVPPGMDGRRITRPATFILNGGQILWRNLTSNYRIRPRAGDVLAALREVTGN